MPRPRVVAALLATLALWACHREHPPAIAYQRVGAEAEELRRAFNADVDKVRVVLLVSPS